MRNNFKRTGGDSTLQTSDALAVKDAALKAALDYIEAQGGAYDWWKNELAYRTHRRLRQALELPEECQKKQTGHFGMLE